MYVAKSLKIKEVMVDANADTAAVLTKYKGPEMEKVGPWKELN